MKLLLLCLSVIALGSAAAVHNERTLQEDWQELVAMIPTDQIVGIVSQYMTNDAEVQGIVQFLKSDEFEGLIVAVDAEPSFIALTEYLEAQGVPIYDWLNALHDLLGIPPVPRPVVSRRQTRGWRDMWGEILATLPLQDLYNWHCGKLAAGEEWKTLYDSLQNEKFRGMVNTFRATSSWQALVGKMGEYGVHTELVVAAIQRFFNWDGDNVDYCINYKP